MTPLRILTVAGWMHPDAEGGSFRFVYELNRALALRGHRPTILTGRVRGDLPLEEDLDGIRVVRFPVKTSGTAAFYYSTFAHVRRSLAELAGGCEIIHTHHPVSAFSTAYSIGENIPMIHTQHIAYFLEYLDRVTGGMPTVTGGQKLAAALLKRMEAYTLNKCRGAVVLSDAVEQQIAEHFPNATDKVVKIPGGVDLEFFSPAGSRLEARERLELPQDRQILLTVRRLEPRMGLDNLIDAMPAIREEFPACLLLIGGRGSLDDTLRTQAAEAGLDDAVQFLGYIDENDLPTYYRAADAFVLPTRALEGFGMVTLEALACGTPAIVTPACAAPEVLEPFDPSLIAAGVEPAHIADAIIKFLNRADREELAQRCRAHAENFSWDAIAEQYEQVYQQAVDAGVEAI
ncbi:MAG: glycosyltransferase family 4 protein [Planctomycetes bacterium]|nr:glycosyltransferase family 4 protein [Planctomycetota bacterium]